MIRIQKTSNSFFPKKKASVSSKTGALGVFFSTILFVSCTTMADYNFRNINNNLASSNYEDVYAELETPKGTLYRNTDKVLETLDKGLICHYSGNYEKSNLLLSQSENLMDKYAAISISQQIGSMISNDTVIDYSGDPYEDIYISIFKALNYLNLGLIDDSFVELRRVNIKLQEISLNYQTLIERSRKELKENSQSVPDSKMTFHNSALARYLSMLMYRSEGNYDDAKIDLRGINEAFGLQKNLYNFPIPSSISKELEVRKNDARLNIIAFSGLCPIKKENRTPLFAVDGFYNVCLPEMVMRKSDINRVRYTATCKETGETYSSELQLLESIENIALDTYSQKYSLTVAKTIGRMVLKLTSALAFDAASQQAGSSELGLLFSVISLASKANMFLSERADVRTCRYFPAYAWVDGITVPAGKYSVTVQFMKDKSTVTSLTYDDIEVRSGNMNLVESFNLR